MKVIAYVFVFAIIVLFVIVPAAAAQLDVVYCHVTQVSYAAEGRPAGDPLVVVKVDDHGKTYVASLAPVSFLKEYSFMPKEGQEIFVKLRRDANDKWIAIQIGQGNRKLELRDPSGRPIW